MFKGLTTLFSKRQEKRSSRMTDEEVLEFFQNGAPSHAGVDISEDSAMRFSTVYACVTLIAETIASLPLFLYQKNPDGSRRKATESDLYHLTHTSPNYELTSFNWREAGTAHLLLWGNCYNLLERKYGQVVKITPVAPHRITVKKSKPYLIYEVSGENGNKRQYRYDDVLHIPGFGYNGLMGQSVIGFAREAIGIGLAAEEFGARFFGNGANPGLTISHPNELGDATWKRLQNSLTKAYSGLGKSHRVMLLEEGMKAERVSIPAKDAQFIELRKFQRSEICGMYKVPPHMIADVEKTSSWGTGIEQQGIGFVTYTLRHWLVRWEQWLNKKLLTEKQKREGFYFEFSVDGLLRGDTKARHETYRIGRAAGYYSVNDIRGLENLDPVEGGDTYLTPLNMVALDDLDKITESNLSPAPLPTEKKSSNIDSCDTLPVFETREDLTDDEKEVASIVEAQAAHYNTIQSALTTVVNDETAAVKTALKSELHQNGHDAFSSWLDDFYSEMPATVKRKIQHVLFTYQDDVVTAAGQISGNRVGESLRRELLKFKSSYLDGLANRYSGSSRAQIDAILEDVSHISVGDIIQAIEDRLNEWDQKRPQKIATDETIRAGNAIARETWARQGITKLKWVTRGSQSCPYCKQQNGRIVGIAEPFFKDGDVIKASDGSGNWMSLKGAKNHPPIHRGCVCAIVPVK